MNAFSKWRGLAFFALVCVMTGLGWANASRTFWFNEETLLNLRIADRFAHGLGFTFFEHDSARGGVSVLWILLVALIRRLTLNVEIAAYITFAGLFLLLNGLIVRAVDRTKLYLRSAVIPLLLMLATAVPYVYSLATYPEPLVLSVGLAWLWLVVDSEPSKKTYFSAGLAGAFLGLAHHDSLVYALPILVGALITNRASRRVIAVAAGGLLLSTVTALVVFKMRIGYWIIPGFWQDGSKSISDWVAGFIVTVRQMSYLVVLLFAMIWYRFRSSSPPARGQALGGIVSSLLWLVLAARTSPSAEPAQHHLVTFMTLASLVLISGKTLDEIEAGSTNKTKMQGSAVFLWAALVGHCFLQWAPAPAVEARGKRASGLDRTSSVQLLQRLFGQQKLIVAMDYAGVLYRTPLLRGLDLRARVHGRSHDTDKSFSERVLKENPDVVIFNSPAGEKKPKYAVGTALVADQNFRSRYGAVLVETRSPVWTRGVFIVKQDSTALGYVDNKSQRIVPGLILASGTNIVVAEDEKNTLGAVVGASALKWESKKLPAGEWTVKVEASGDDVMIRASNKESEVEGINQIVVEGGSALTFEFSASNGARSHIRRLVFNKK